uniref:Protein kinase domain-containing protein n=1 Tax=Arcella intermedia TaxID=1963864 RepID=A0A6B2L240_9EUKA
MYETIGKGSFGKVKLGEHVSLGLKVAVKIINREKLNNSKNDARIKREIQAMQRLNHPHIVRLYDVIESKTHIFIIMEYVSGGELFNTITTHGKFSEPEAREFFQQIISAISYCHQSKVAHRDLKPENLLFDPKTRTIKIADFGLSNIVDDGALHHTACGSPNYAAPEVISGNQYSGPEADIWSCGVILYALLTARLPFDDPYIPTLFRRIREGKYSMPPFLSNEAKDLISKILVCNPVDRLTVKEIRMHSWHRENLPKYLEVTADVPEETKSEYSERAINEVSLRMKVSHTQILEDLEKSQETGLNGPYTVAYHLVSDSLQLGRDVKDASFSYKDSNSRFSAAIDEISSSPAMNLRRVPPIYEDGIRREIDKTRKISEDAPVAPLKKVWYLGFLSAHHPLEIFEKLLVALKKHDFEWKVCGNYQLRCRNILKDGNQHPLKIGIQLFSMPQNSHSSSSGNLKKKIHLLDIKILEGQMFDFYEICLKLSKEIPSKKE